jgi:hypothetical protein
MRSWRTPEAVLGGTDMAVEVGLARTVPVSTDSILEGHMSTTIGEPDVDSHKATLTEAVVVLSWIRIAELCVVDFGSGVPLTELGLGLIESLFGSALLEDLDGCFLHLSSFTP